MSNPDSPSSEGLISKVGNNISESPPSVGGCEHSIPLAQQGNIDNSIFPLEKEIEELISRPILKKQTPRMMTSLKTLLEWLYGSGGRSERLRESSALLLGKLSTQSSLEYKAVVTLLGSWKRNGKIKKSFYATVNPLKAVGLLKVVKTRQGKEWRTEYMLTPERFEGFMMAQVKDVVRSLK